MQCCRRSVQDFQPSYYLLYLPHKADNAMGRRILIILRLLAPLAEGDEARPDSSFKVTWRDSPSSSCLAARGKLYIPPGQPGQLGHPG